MSSPKLKIVNEEQGSLPLEMQKLGFTDYEARIYIKLLQISPATAYEVSKEAGVPRSNAYGALESLTRKMAVQPVSEDPVRYVAMDPQVLLKRISGSTSELCENLANSLSKIAKPEDSHYVWTAWNEGAVHEQIEKLINEAESCIWIKASDHALRKHAKDLEAAAKRGLDFLVVMFGKDADEFRYSDKVRIFLHEGSGIRTIAADNYFTLTVDHAVALAVSVGENGVFASYTRNDSIVTMAEALIRHDFYMAEIFKHLGPQIDEIFGPNMMSLRKTCFTVEQFEELNTRIKNM